MVTVRTWLAARGAKPTTRADTAAGCGVTRCTVVAPTTFVAIRTEMIFLTLFCAVSTGEARLARTFPGYVMTDCIMFTAADAIAVFSKSSRPTWFFTLETFEPSLTPARSSHMITGLGVIAPTF